MQGTYTEYGHPAVLEACSTVFTRFCMFVLPPLFAFFSITFYLNELAENLLVPFDPDDEFKESSMLEDERNLWNIWSFLLECSIFSKEIEEGDTVIGVADSTISECTWKREINYKLLSKVIISLTLLLGYAYFCLNVKFMSLTVESSIVVSINL